MNSTTLRRFTTLTTKNTTLLSRSIFQNSSSKYTFVSPYKNFHRGFSKMSQEELEAMNSFMTKSQPSALKRSLMEEKTQKLSGAVAKLVLVFETWTLLFCLSFGGYVLYNVTLHKDQDLLTIIKRAFANLGVSTSEIRAKLKERKNEIKLQEMQNKEDTNGLSEEDQAEKILLELEAQEIAQKSKARSRFV